MAITIVNANPYGPLSPERLGELEEKIHVHLPTDYREFLLRYNGGQPIPSFFWIIDKKDGSRVHRFYGLYSKAVPFCIETYIGSERYGIPASMLPIGDDGTGNFICIGIGSHNFGNIFFLDHEEHPFHDPDSMKGITLLTNSFQEFLSCLHEEPE